MNFGFFRAAFCEIGLAKDIGIPDIINTVNRHFLYVLAIVWCILVVVGCMERNWAANLIIITAAGAIGVFTWGKTGATSDPGKGFRWCAIAMSAFGAVMAALILWERFIWGMRLVP